MSAPIRKNGVNAAYVGVLERLPFSLSLERLRRFGRAYGTSLQ